MRGSRTFSRVVMTTTAACLMAAGLVATFMPRELAGWLAVTGPGSETILVQLLGASCVGFALLDWSARGSLIGGIYGRPVALGNFGFLLIAALALVKASLPADLRPAQIALIAVSSLLALGFARVLFVHPLPSSGSS